jgi:hypothetical protein
MIESHITICRSNTKSYIRAPHHPTEHPIEWYTAITALHNKLLGAMQPDPLATTAAFA